MAGLEIPALNGGVELRNSTLHGGISIPMFDRVFAYWYLVGNAWECMGIWNGGKAGSGCKTVLDIFVIFVLIADRLSLVFLGS